MKPHLLTWFTFCARYLLWQPISGSLKTASAPSKGRPQYLFLPYDPPSPVECDWIESRFLGQYRTLYYLRPRITCFGPSPLSFFLSLLFSVYPLPTSCFFAIISPLNLDQWTTMKAKRNSSKKNCPVSIWESIRTIIQKKRHQKLEKNNCSNHNLSSKNEENCNPDRTTKLHTPSSSSVKIHFQLRELAGLQILLTVRQLNKVVILFLSTNFLKVFLKYSTFYKFWTRS